MTYRPDIQGLRAIAVLLVIAYHAGASWLPGGFVGVDVFFVISGFLITFLLLREAERTGTVSLVDFYARRARRLLPAATVVIVATTAVASLLYSPFALNDYAYAAFAASLYASNLWFARRSTDYFAEGTESNPLLHTWSLGVEEQFYFVWPLLVLVAVRSGRDIRRQLLITLTVIVVASFVASVLLTRYSQPLAFFASPTRAWEFAAGGLLALSLRPAAAAQSRLALGVLGALALALSALLYHESTPFPGSAAALPVIGTVLLLLAGPGSPVGRLLSSRPMQLVGDMSYSLYLWHWPVLIFWPEWAHKAGALALVFVLSWATWRFVENPIRYRALRLPGRAIAAGLGLTATSVVVAVGAGILSGQQLARPEHRALMAAMELPRIYADGCHAAISQTELRDCVYGDRSSDRTIVLFGDSHAAHWFPAFERIALEQGWRLVPLTKSGCPSVIYEPYIPQFGRPYHECSEWRERALLAIADRKPELLVISNEEKVHAHWEAGMQELLSRAATVSERVLILRTVPLPDQSPLDCLSAAAESGAEPRCFAHAKRLPPIEHAFENVVAQDLGDVICPTEPCAVIDGDVVKYRDASHLSVRYSARLAAELAEVLGPAAPDGVVRSEPFL